MTKLQPQKLLQQIVIKLRILQPKKLDFAYTLDEPYDNCQPGDQKHVSNDLKSLKA